MAGRVCAQVVSGRVHRGGQRVLGSGELLARIGDRHIKHCPERREQQVHHVGAGSGME